METALKEVTPILQDRAKLWESMADLGSVKQFLLQEQASGRYVPFTPLE